MNIEITAADLLSYLPFPSEIIALQNAIKTTSEFDNPDQEEVGGFITCLESEGRYTFIPIKNANAGTPTAKGLYTADKQEFGRTIIPLLARGYKIDSSFHYHPGFSAQPSGIDLNQLFQTFRKNYIYAEGGDLRMYKSMPSPQDEAVTVKEYFARNYYLTRKQDTATIWQTYNVTLNGSE